MKKKEIKALAKRLESITGIECINVKQKNITMKYLLITIALFLVCIVHFVKINELKTELKESIKKNIESNKECIIHSEKLLKHDLINIELNNITDQFQSSRNEKLRNKELINLMSNLN